MSSDPVPRSGAHPVSRRLVLGGGAALLYGAGALRAEVAVDERLTIYSPAPADNPLHVLNLQFAEALGAAIPPIAVTMPPVALPESINRFAEVDAAERALHLPIVTTVDYPAAVAGKGPTWHAYSRANRDLRFVSKLYDVGFGIMGVDPAIRTPQDLRGKRIAAPPRPSAVRWMTEVLLRDGWGMLDAVELVDMPAAGVPAAIASDRVDAVAWNLVLPGPTGFRTAFAALPALADGRFLPVAADALGRINACNEFTLALVPLLPSQPPLLGFSQALAAWDTTPDAVVAAMLAVIREQGAAYPGLPITPQAMIDWPGLSPAMLHPAAQSFHGVL